MFEKKRIQRMKVSIRYTIIISILLQWSLFAQQYPQFTQYTYNMNIINPAYAGVKDALSINVLGRTQWIGVEGAPKTGTLGIHSSLGQSRNFGAGFSAIYTEVGPVKETHLYGDLAYKLNVYNEGVLSFGLKFGASLQNLNQALLRFTSNENFNTNLTNKTYANLGFGLFFSQEEFYVSLSVPNVLSTNFFDVESTLDTTREVARNGTVFLGGGYVFEVSESLKIKPAVMLRYSSSVPFATDISSTAFIDEIFELGASYRINESIAVIAALNLNKNFRVGYSYDFSTGGILNSNGSHEIMLLFDMDLKERIRRVPKYY
ncbi:PorP/SprF family type IX secretion system membrane protein [Tenacibaculum agarivorans]|uniref:PorP/SprF family type IX secretion system membrane protein n=1 Tax=Tenacibaculum agarivorans TaxID=1908389 RepID=UPI000A7442D6|nr:type IX secretion system membrane protein PorP/SprF [Tenacibaculum agarivorans]